MKTQILSKGNASVSLIGVLILMTTTLFGNPVNKEENMLVIGLDPVILTQKDLPMMDLTQSDHFRGNSESSFIVRFEQRWNGRRLVVRYWLFDTSSTAKIEADRLTGTLGAALIFEPELNPEAVIGDATWYRVEKRSPILFVKNNVVVLVFPGAGPGYRHSPHRLQFAQEVARKIEAKIAAVLLENGKRVVSGSVGNTVGLWDVEMGTLLQTFKGHKGSVASVSFSPDGKRIASGGADGTVRLWDAGTGNRLQTLKGHKGSVASVSFSPDGKRVVSGSLDKTVRLWSAIKGSHLQTLKGHEGEVLSVSFSPDGKRVASGGTDGTVGLWDVEMGTLLQTLTEHRVKVLSVSFSPDGKRVVSGSVDETILLWDTSLVK